MCGIAGFQLTPGFKPDGTYKTLLLLSLATGMDVRGGDSYGVAKTNNKGELKLWKGLGRAIGGLKLREAADTSQLILHTRKRTHGPIDLYNAHPIVQGHIVGTHNGMVSNHDTLNKRYKRDFALDSRHIFEHLRTGLDVGEINVYGAISWIDTNQPNIVNLCKLSTHGDLVIYGIGPDKENILGVVYASTPGCIENAFNALHQPIFKYEGIEEKRRYWLEGGRLFTDPSKEGRLPFGDSPLYHGWADTGSGHRSAVTLEKWKPPTGFVLCKPCRKAHKKAKAFHAHSLCSPCWNRYMNFDTPDKKHTQTGYKCAKCRQKNGTVRYGIVAYCTECWESTPGNKKEDMKKSLSHDSRHLALVPAGALKPGDLSEDEQKLLDLTGEGGRKGLAIPPYLDQWDLCTWCAREAFDNKGWNHNDFCGGCKKSWAIMMTELRYMEKEERALFSQVVQCGVCRVVPTFGWLKSEALTDDGKVKVSCARCKRIGNDEKERGVIRAKTPCVLCGENDDVRTTYAQPIITDAGKSLDLVPYCRSCFSKRGEIVALMNEQQEEEKKENGRAEEKRGVDKVLKTAM
jgi:hypothetical protein